MNKKHFAPSYTTIPTEGIVKGIVNNPNNQDLVEYLTSLAKELEEDSSIKLIGGNSCWLNEETFHYSFIFEDLQLAQLPKNFRENKETLIEVRKRENYRTSEILGFVFSFTDNEQHDLKIQDSDDAKYIIINFSIS